MDWHAVFSFFLLLPFFLFYPTTYFVSSITYVPHVFKYQTKFRTAGRELRWTLYVNQPESLAVWD